MGAKKISAFRNGCKKIFGISERVRKKVRRFGTDAKKILKDALGAEGLGFFGDVPQSISLRGVCQVYMAFFIPVISSEIDSMTSD